MSVIGKEQRTCAICKKQSEHFVCLGGSYPAECGLDTRPSRAARNDFDYDVQMCPHCGYSYIDIEEAYGQELSQEYCSIKNDDSIDAVSKKLLLAYIVAFNKREYEMAFELLLKASWTLEDNGNSFNLQIMNTFVYQLEAYLQYNRDDDAEIVLIDVLRRMGSFDKARAHIKSLGITSSDIANKILAYQGLLIDRGDKSHHLMTEVI